MTLKMIVPLEVGIAVQDLTLMRSFYEDVLGFRFVSEVFVPEGNAQKSALSLSGYTVARLQTSYGERLKLLHPANVTASESSPEYILDKPNASYLTFIVDDITATLEQLIAKGVEFMTGDQRVEVRPGIYLAFCRDPEGNVLEIVQYTNIQAYRDDLK